MLVKSTIMLESEPAIQFVCMVTVPFLCGVFLFITAHQSKTCGHGHSDQGSRVPSFWLDALPSMPVMQVSWHHMFAHL